MIFIPDEADNMDRNLAKIERFVPEVEKALGGKRIFKEDDQK